MPVFLNAPWQIPEDEIAAPGMLHVSRRSHGGSHIDDGCECIDFGRRANSLHVVHPILKTNDGGARREMRQEGFCRLLGVQRLHAKEHNLRITRGAHLGGCRNRNLLLKMQAVKE